eukprot:19199-Heterococcus_DN1.PRE.2
MPGLFVVFGAVVVLESSASYNRHNSQHSWYSITAAYVPDAYLRYVLLSAQTDTTTATATATAILWTLSRNDATISDHTCYSYSYSNTHSSVTAERNTQRVRTAPTLAQLLQLLQQHSALLTVLVKLLPLLPLLLLRSALLQGRCTT